MRPLLSEVKRKSEDRDAVAAERSDPQLVADLDGDGAGAEARRVRPAGDLPNHERLRVDLDDDTCLAAESGAAALAGGEDRPVTRPADIVHLEPELHFVALRRHLSAGEAEERLAAPRGDVQGPAVFGHLQAIRARALAPENLLPARGSVPLPWLAIQLALLQRRKAGRTEVARQEIGRDESAVRKPSYRVQSDRIRRHGTPDPGQQRSRLARV